MKCPYCCEAVDDRAVVCPKCHRDLGFFRPIWSRLREAEDALDRLRSDLAELTRHKRVELRPSDAAPTLALFCSVLLAFLFTWLDWRPSFNGVNWDHLLQSLSICSPFFAALGLGMVVPRVQASSSLLLGLVAGLAGEVQMLILFAVGRVDIPVRSTLLPKPEVYVIYLPTRWYWSLVLYAVGGCLLFFCGTLAGQWLRRGSTDEVFTTTVSQRRLAGLKVALTTIGTVAGMAIPIIRGVLDSLGPKHPGVP